MQLFFRSSKNIILFSQYIKLIIIKEILLQLVYINLFTKSNKDSYNKNLKTLGINQINSDALKFLMMGN